MVLGLRSKHRKGASIPLDYIIHVQEISPWPPSQSLRSIQSVMLQWENGDHSSGSLTSEVGEIKIEFNESFTLSLILQKDKKSHDKFQKNYLEFQLYEPRKDKVAKGQLLGTALVNLGDYGIIDDILTISVPLNCKKSSKITLQPILYIRVQPIDKDSSNTSSVSSLSKQASLEKDGQEFVSGKVNNEMDNDSIASFTDDDESSHSSRTVGSSVCDPAGASPSQNEKDVSELAIEGDRRVTGDQNLALGAKPAILAADPLIVVSKEKDGRSNVMSLIDSSDLQNPVNNHAYSSLIPGRSSKLIPKEPGIPLPQSRTEEVVNIAETSTEGDAHQSVPDNSLNRIAGKSESGGNGLANATMIDDVHGGLWGGKERGEQQDIGLDEQRQISEDNLVGKFLAARKQNKLRSNTLASNRNIPRVQGNTTLHNGKLKHLNSVQLPKASAFTGNCQVDEKVNKLEKVVDKGEGASLKKNVVTEIKIPTDGSSDSKTESRSRIEMLEEELREAAAIEVSLYSIVAEHGGSINKVHAPARRLSRFYLHACKERSQEKMANAARAAISGLTLVSKACGNDVPRLTFWLSNSSMLRAIVSQAMEDKSLLGKCKESSPIEGNTNSPTEEYGDWEDQETFIIALEKVEAWIFSRIIESVWWQTLTPHMQSTAAKASSRNTGHSSRKNKIHLGDQEQGRFSVELWKKAFKDACERLCPVRAGGHECGCLPSLARLVMEQLVGRLDVAMFNAVLRDSGDEMPTDPVSDPIADSKVLPVPAGRSSFGAGAQLKNAIGSWSIWLTDLFGIEDNDSLEDNDDLGHDKRIELDTAFKPFRLLNALSDLMMLPCEMLADKSTRKEVCPTFSASLIKRVVYNFVPDEFCPNPIPSAVLEALDSEDNDSMEAEASADGLTSFPCIATPTVYSPPPAAALAGLVGETAGSQALRRSGSSVLKKSYTSDDELDELDSPLTSMITCNSSTLSRPNWTPSGGRSIVRYQLLREVWRDGE